MHLIISLDLSSVLSGVVIEIEILRIARFNITVKRKMLNFKCIIVLQKFN